MNFFQYQFYLAMTVEAANASGALDVVRRALAGLLPEGEEVTALTSNGAITAVDVRDYAEAGEAVAYTLRDLRHAPA